MSLDDPIDLTMLTERCFSDRGFVRELLAVFLKQAEAELPLLGAALSAGDMSRLRGLAHKLKGSAANVSAIPLNRLCAELEMLAQSRSTERAAELISQIETEVRRCGIFITSVH